MTLMLMLILYDINLTKQSGLFYFIYRIYVLSSVAGAAREVPML